MIEILDISNIQAYVSEALEMISINKNLGKNFIFLIYVVVVFYMAKVAVSNLLKSGEGFSFDMIKTPVFYILLITAWPYLYSYVEFAIQIFKDYVSMGQQDLLQVSNSISTDFNTFFEKFEAALREKDLQALGSDPNIFKEIKYKIAGIDSKITMSMTKGMFSIMTYVDTFILISFYIITEIWLKLVSFGGPIALVVSLYSGGYTVLINWAKSFISVSLWVPVGGLVIQLINKIMVRIVTGSIKPAFEGHIAMGDDLGIAALTLKSHEIMSLLSMLIGFFLVFIALKIIVLGKTPQIISTWIGGGSSAGGGLAAAFIGMAVAKNAITSTTHIAAGAATSKNKLKKNG